MEFFSYYIIINMKKRIILVIIIIIFCLSIILIRRNYLNKEKKDYSNQFTIIEKIKNDNNGQLIKDYQNEFNNSDIIAELSFENTNIKTPLAQGKNNSYYLNHLYDKTKNNIGSIFLDYRNKLSDKKIIIYGHNSRYYNITFRELENYLNNEYVDDHKHIYLKTETKTLEYEIFSIYVEEKDFKHVNLKFDDNNYLEHLQYLKSKSFYNNDIVLSKEDNIIVIQTCYYNPKNSFLILAGKKIDK